VGPVLALVLGALALVVPAVGRATRAADTDQPACVTSGQAASGEKRYGPYPVPPAKWVATAVALVKGQGFRVSTTG